MRLPIHVLLVVGNPSRIRNPGAVAFLTSDRDTQLPPQYLSVVTHW
jgi:hypothetical protein